MHTNLFLFFQQLVGFALGQGLRVFHHKVEVGEMDEGVPVGAGDVGVDLRHYHSGALDGRAGDVDGSPEAAVAVAVRGTQGDQRDV
jgi:hypothetical protein